MQKTENPYDLLAEFKLATGKGQLIRANEMATKLFAYFLSEQAKQSSTPVLWTDIVGKPEICDPAQCACKTAKASKAASLDSLVTHRDTTAAASQNPTGETIMVPGDLIVTGNVRVGSWTVGHDEVAAPAPISIAETLEFLDEPAKLVEDVSTDIEPISKPRKKK